MENPRPEKVAVVDEVRERLTSTDAALLTEYRGIDVAGMARLRRALHAAGGDYKIYKNTLMRLAARGAGLDLEPFLTGPTAIAFVTSHPDGRPGDPVTVAKALADFARTDPHLVVKGGLLDQVVLGAEEARALAEIAPRDELLARFAGGLAAPMQRFAGLLQALPRNFAYGLAALIDQGGARPESDAAEVPAATDEATSDEATTDEPGATDEAATTDEASATDETAGEPAPNDN